MKKTLLILTLLTLLLITASCSNGIPKTSGQELVIGVLPAESAIPIILAKENGYFDDVNMTVTITSFSSPNDRNVAVQSNSVDAVIGDVMTAASFVDRGLSLVITSDISEDFKILSSPDSGITSMSDLNGKTVSLVPNFILEYIMDEFANEAGIKGGTLLFTEEMVTERPEDIKAFYIAYNRAVDFMNDNDVDTYSAILSNYNFPEAISAYLTSMNDDFQHANVISTEQLTKIIDWTVSKGQISQSYTYDKLTDFSFIK